MKSPATIQILLGLLLLVIPALASGASEAAADKSDQPTVSRWLPRGLQRDPAFRYSMISSVTTAGEEWMKTKPASTGYTLTEEKPVFTGDLENPQRVEAAGNALAVVKAVLAHAGLVEGGAPEISVKYEWGICFHEPAGYGQEDMTDNARMIDPGNHAQMQNLAARSWLVGGSAFSKEFIQAVSRDQVTALGGRDQHTFDLVALSLGDVYYVQISAFKTSPTAKPLLFWKARIATDCRGLNLAALNASLTKVVGAYFGRDSNGWLIKTARLYDGKVEVGPLDVLPDSATAK